MSAFNISQCADVTIPSGGSASSAVSAQLQYADADYIILAAPSGLLAGEAGVIQVSFDNSTWFTLSNSISSVTYPAASTATEYIAFTAPYFRLSVSSGTVAADRTFKMWKAWKGC